MEDLLVVSSVKHGTGSRFGLSVLLRTGSCALIMVACQKRASSSIDER